MFDHNETLLMARARNVRDALIEDVGRGDWTSRLIPKGTTVSAKVVVRQDAVLCGQEWFDNTLHSIDSTATIAWHYPDGFNIRSGTTVCDIRADAQVLLCAERTAINFLQLLSWTATNTRRHVLAIEGVSPNPNGCMVMDTRKTIPGLRQAQKYAVRIGGGTNQRLALWHGILIKENHILAAGGIREALMHARALNANVDIQIEVESLEELELALECDAKNILIDNFTLPQMHRAVEVTHGRATLEASGGVSLDQLRKIAQTGVDRISIGKLTKDVIAVDYSLRIN
jgi:nicotinate-nucleotide pyrophosphorylase (carboxylating)